MVGHPCLVQAQVSDVVDRISTIVTWSGSASQMYSDSVLRFLSPSLGYFQPESKLSLGQSVGLPGPV